MAIADKKETELLEDHIPQSDSEDSDEILDEENKVTVSLLQQDDEIGPRSGLNWGQRPGRESNQAYIPVNSAVRDTEYFPPIGTYFNVITDNGRHMIFVRAQQNGKALETPQSNSILGTYFRELIGVKSGKFVTKEDLENYGRNTVDFYKIDYGYYYIDLSV